MGFDSGAREAAGDSPESQVERRHKPSSEWNSYLILKV